MSMIFEGAPIRLCHTLPIAGNARSQPQAAAYSTLKEAYEADSVVHHYIGRNFGDLRSRLFSSRNLQRNDRRAAHQSERVCAISFDQFVEHRYFHCAGGPELSQL